MLRLNNLPLPLDGDDAALRALCCRKLRIPPEAILEMTLARKSVDARDKENVHFVCTVDLKLRDEAAVLRRLKPHAAETVQPWHPAPVPQARFERRPVVVGAGPAGLFAALPLARAAVRPLLMERGRPVEERVRDVEAMARRGELNPESNVQFGEGGAGTFSDGKLTTGTKSPLQRDVLETFIRHGAPEEIRWLHKPHIGTDLLRGIVVSMRREIIALGGEVRFGTRLERLVIRKGQVEAAVVSVNGAEQEILTDNVFLCTGHSARDTFQHLFQQGVRMGQKPFAVGVRIEHPQALIDRAQYGLFAGHPALGAADYKLNLHTPDGRGVYTFCMCPGGEVVAAASQPEGLAVNGMSLHARDGRNANAALLVGVRPGDWGDDHPLSGLVWQRGLEQAAFRAGGGGFRAPVQRVEDFLAGRATVRLGDVEPTYRPGVTCADLRDCLPPFVTEDLRLGIRGMDSQLHGFAHPDAVLTGVETRSSSPVRIPRAADLMAEEITGLYPVGEGAGYAGGIVSAAVDGIRCALAAIERSLA